MLNYKLLLVLVLIDSSPTEDSGDSLGGVLVGRALALVPISALAVFGLVVTTSLTFRWFTAECFVQASTLPYGVRGVLVDRTLIVHELGVVGVIGALSVGVDGIDSLSTQNLCPVLRTHASSRKGLLDGAVDLPSFSKGMVYPMHSLETCQSI